MKRYPNQKTRFIDRFYGIYPAIPTPLTPGGEVDDDALIRLARYLLDGGVHGIWALGSGGELPALSVEQRRRVLSVIVDALGGEVPVVAGISGTAPDDIHRNAHVAADEGADAVFMIAPYYFHYRLPEIASCFEAAAESSPLPLVVYHNSHNSKIRLNVEMVLRLADHPNIVGLKDAGCDFALFQSFHTALKDRDDFRLFQGDDTTMAASFLLGARGAVAAVPVLAPRLVVELYEVGRQKDVDTSFELQRQCMDLFRIYEVTGPMNDSAFLATQKAALELMGFGTRVPASPCAPLSENYMPRIREILLRHDLLDVGRLTTRVGK